jgi:dCMP deaminase
MSEFYMTLAEECSRMSRAVRLQVGAVIVKNNNIISFSWNGTPSGWDNCCEHTLDDGTLVTKPEVMHAERNAIDKLARSQQSGSGATIFITHAPCVECAKSIYMSGIEHVYYRHNYRSNDGIEFLKKCGLPVEQI